MTVRTATSLPSVKVKAPLNVGLGQLVVGTQEDELVIYGLGSCIGLVLWSPSKKIGALGHIVMPDSRGSALVLANPAKFADWAVPQALAAILSRGAWRSDLVAKLAGGAHTLGGVLSNNIGALNTQATLGLLETLHIPVAGKCVGGTVGRTIRFYPASGRVDVRQVNGTTEVL